ncbi:hypothetical protein Q0590_34020 [Rhodocytophaga aerolata]|uniref:Lipoprotein n=1 Tax=Rhodocytophaga aerolata TaxID=455078 RepID=A0ABT8RGV1_9BACT|nr:hypothetical protein [Rhodocytophaga aerolata]MDO1451342.1 hypothetical protein [Rhodocytophaga aerolata]
MFKLSIFSSFSFLLLLLTIISCNPIKELIHGPTFDLVPKITPKPGRIYPNIIDSQLGNRVDSLILVLHFEDGDGDLGLSSDDRETNPHFRQYNPDGSENKYWYNYFAKAYRKVNGQFVEVIIGAKSVTYSGAFPPLKADGKPGPIEGDLEYSIYYPLKSTPANDTVRFEIQLVDRALNESNIILTEPMIVNRK